MQMFSVLVELFISSNEFKAEVFCQSCIERVIESDIVLTADFCN